MRLMTPAEMVALLGSKACGGEEGGSTALVLDMILPRLEDAMNVASLVRGKFVDTFVLPTYDPQHVPLVLRLSNGYVVKDTIKVQAGDDPDFLASASHFLDLEMGTVSMHSWSRGTISVEYESGFKPKPELIDDPQNPGNQIPKPVNELVLEGVPDWMKALAVGFMVEWYRTFQTIPKFKPEVSYAQVEAALRRHIYARIYGRYMRPRAGVVWPSQTIRVD